MHYNLTGKIANTRPYGIDATLTEEGSAAEAKATGDAIKAVKESAAAHEAAENNPHHVTKEQIGLGNVDNTSDHEKPVSTAQAAAIADAKKAGTDAMAALDYKVSVEEGKGLSTNDFTDEYKAKLDGIEEGGGEFVLEDESVTTAKIASGAVTSAKISAGAVTTEKIASGAVTPDQLSKAYLPLTGGTVTGATTFSNKATFSSTMVLGSVSYGTTLPNPGTKGRIFFLKRS